jgi:hypothetical protein
MRTVNKSISITKLVATEETITSEELSVINEDKSTKIITAIIKQYNANSCQINEVVTIVSGNNYDLLMSANPSWAAGKPANEYRETDLWYIIDLVRKGA